MTRQPAYFVCVFLVGVLVGGCGGSSNKLMPGDGGADAATLGPGVDGAGGGSAPDGRPPDQLSIMGMTGTLDGGTLPGLVDASPRVDGAPGQDMGSDVASGTDAVTSDTSPGFDAAPSDASGVDMAAPVDGAPAVDMGAFPDSAPDEAPGVDGPMPPQDAPPVSADSMPEPDVAPPDASSPAVTVTLTASTNSVTGTAPVELTVTAVSTAGFVGKVDLYQGNTLIGTKNAVPAVFTVSFVEGDNGQHTFTATAHTATANGTSAPVVITVAIPVDPCGADKVTCLVDACGAGKCLAPAHVASGFGAWSRAAGLKDVVLAGSVTFDTSTGAAGSWRGANLDPTIYEVNRGIGFVRVDQGAGEPSLAIWVFKSARFTGGMVGFVGGAAAVLASAGSLTVEAAVTFDIGARKNAPGAGGFPGGQYGMDGEGCAPGKGSTNGGGGGGYGTDGGSGTGGGLGGKASACDAYAALSPLRGGSGGGGGDDSNAAQTIRFGGAGGGALQISAMGPLAFDGVVNAGGGGGRTPQGNSRRGAGGGAGGAIFLESPALTLGATAGLYANGGGGGSSSAGTGSSCQGTPVEAEDGKASLEVALGSRCGAVHGGNGAAGTAGATNGSGGGGALGRIVLRTLPAATPAVGTTNLSPGPAAAAYKVVTTLGD